MPNYAMCVVEKETDSAVIVEIRSNASAFDKQASGQDLFVLWSPHKPGDRIDTTEGEEFVRPEALYWPVVPDSRGKLYRLTDDPIMAHVCSTFRSKFTGRTFDRMLYAPVSPVAYERWPV